MNLPQTPSFRLDGRRALVAGATSGIGLAAATALAAAGAHVTAVARSETGLADLVGALLAQRCARPPRRIGRDCRRRGVANSMRASSRCRPCATGSTAASGAGACRSSRVRCTTRRMRAGCRGAGRGGCLGGTVRAADSRFQRQIAGTPGCIDTRRGRFRDRRSVPDSRHRGTYRLRPTRATTRYGRKPPASDFFKKATNDCTDRGTWALYGRIA